VRCVSEPAVDETRSFAATTGALIELQEWLSSHAVTHVAMEATGVYWKPVWHLLEEHFELVLANAQHIKNVPGRKTDVNDAAWIADLLAHGLISASFVPPKPIQELRDLTRTRKQLVREVSQHSLRIQKTLEDANIKLGSVLSDVLGHSGRAILNALIAGETDPERLADLARGNARKKRAELIQALHGRISAHHRRLLKLHLGLIDALQQALATVDADVGKTLAPIEECARLLTTMPGVSELTAHVLVAEIGVDMARFPTAGHVLSWATMCPRNDESAGKRRSTRTRKGAKPPWSRPPGPPSASVATCRPSSCASKLVAAPKKPFWRSPPRCSTPLGTCSRIGSNIKILAPITSLAAIAPRRSDACSDDSMISAARSNSRLRLPERSVVRICANQRLLNRQGGDTADGPVALQRQRKMD
jgi:transposase